MSAVLIVPGISERITPPRLFIGGKPVGGEGATELSVVDPATGRTRALYRGASPAQVDDAIAAAARAVRAGAALPAVERGAILRDAATLIRERADDIARA